MVPLRVVKIIKTESIMVVSRVGIGKKGELLFHIVSYPDIQFYKMKRVIVMNIGDGCTTMKIPLNCICKNVQNVKWMYFSIIKK